MTAPHGRRAILAAAKPATSAPGAGSGVATSCEAMPGTILNSPKKSDSSSTPSLTKRRTSLQLSLEKLDRLAAGGALVVAAAGPEAGEDSDMNDEDVFSVLDETNNVLSQEIKYGDTLTLKATSAFTKKRCAVGVYIKHGLVGLGDDEQPSFRLSRFTVFKGNSKESYKTLRYGVPFKLMDDKGEYWGIPQGGLSTNRGLVISRKNEPVDGQVRFIVWPAPSDCDFNIFQKCQGQPVHYDEEIILNVAPGAGIAVRLTHHRKANSGLKAGYLRTDSHGKGITFSLVPSLTANMAITPTAIVEKVSRTFADRMKEEEQEQEEQLRLLEVPSAPASNPASDAEEAEERQHGASEAEAEVEVEEDQRAKADREEAEAVKRDEEACMAARQRKKAVFTAVIVAVFLLAYGFLMLHRKSLVTGCFILVTVHLLGKIGEVNRIDIKTEKVKEKKKVPELRTQEKEARTKAKGNKKRDEKKRDEKKETVKRGQSLKALLLPGDLASKVKTKADFTSNAQIDAIARATERFIEAEKGDDESALVRFKHTLKWRLANNVDTILNRPHGHFDAIKTNTVQYFHGRARNGSPVYIEMPKQTKIKQLNDMGIGMSHLIYHYVYICEFLWQVIEPNDIKQSCSIIDVEGVVFADFRGDVKEFVKAVSAISAAHYPGRSHHIFVVNASWSFAMIWKFLKNFLDPVTREKVHLYSSTDPYDEDLQKYIHPDQIPERYGGNCRCYERHVGSREKKCQGSVEEEQMRQLAHAANAAADIQSVVPGEIHPDVPKCDS